MTLSRLESRVGASAAPYTTKFGSQCGQTMGRAGQGVPSDGTDSGSCGKGGSFSLKKQ